LISKVKSWFRSTPAGEINIAAASDPKEPSLSEVLLMFAVMFVLHLWTLCRVKSFWSIATTWPDNPSYLYIAAVIRNGHFSGGEMPHHFWGFSYAIAGISKLLSMPGLIALVAISMLGSLIACLLVHRLYGGWVAAAFVFINYEWIILSVEGSNEPLFMCLLFASFLAARSSRWNLAALLASLATTVRPLGVFALLCFAIALAVRKSYRQLAVITLIGLAIGVLYVIPLWIILGSPFANFTGYRPDWGPHGWLITFPFGALVPAYLSAYFAGTRWYTLVYIAVWPVLALAGAVRIWPAIGRQKSLAMYQPEALFATVYTLFLLSYNYFGIVWYFSRFLIPVVPLLLFSLRDWIPKDRRVLWGAAVISALLSSAAIVGFRQVFGFRLP
jgi:hypothetical protein